MHLDENDLKMIEEEIKELIGKLNEYPKGYAGYYLGIVERIEYLLRFQGEHEAEEHSRFFDELSKIFDN